MNKRGGRCIRNEIDIGDVKPKCKVRLSNNKINIIQITVPRQNNLIIIILNEN